MPTYTNSNNMGSFVWVNSEKEAIEYPVSANTGVLMMNRNSPVIYMKQADAYGRPLPVEVYDLVKRVPPEPEKPPVFDTKDYVKTTDLNSALRNYVTAEQMTGMISDLVKSEFDKLMK